MRIETRSPVVKEFAVVPDRAATERLALASCCRQTRTGNKGRPLKLNRFNVGGCLRGRLASSINSSDNRFTFSSESGSGATPYENVRTTFLLDRFGTALLAPVAALCPGAGRIDSRGGRETFW